MHTENLSELLGRVSENSTSQIDDLVGDFGRLREKLRTDGDATDEDHLRKRGESSSISGSPGKSLNRLPLGLNTRSVKSNSQSA